MRAGLIVVWLLGCGDDAMQTPRDAGEDAVIADGHRLDPAPGIYRETCDGSGATALDLDHFIDVNDENQSLRVYRRGADGPPLQTLEISNLLGLQVADEGDLEELARIGDRIFAITSHGRNTSGNVRPARYRFGALDLETTTLPIAFATTPRFTIDLLAQMLDEAHWDVPHAEVIAALATSTKLGDNSEPSLAPEDMGTNIEGLAATAGGHLLIGFRNPRPNARAIVVELANPDEVVAGAAARFAGAAELELGGLGIRSLAYSLAHEAVLIVAGPHDGAGPFRLYRWSGALADAPAMVTDLTAPASSAPEAVVAYPGTTDVQIIFDQGDFLVNGTICKDVPVADRFFGDQIVAIP